MRGFRHIQGNRRRHDTQSYRRWHSRRPDKSMPSLSPNFPDGAVRLSTCSTHCANWKAKGFRHRYERHDRRPVIAEFKCNLSSERVKSGLAAEKVRGQQARERPKADWLAPKVAVLMAASRSYHDPNLNSSFLSTHRTLYRSHQQVAKRLLI